jgi:hypothetical protein
MIAAIVGPHALVVDTNRLKGLLGWCGLVRHSILFLLLIMGPLGLKLDRIPTTNSTDYPI